MFFLCQHENGKDELSREHHFDEETLCKTCSLTQRRSDVEGCREQYTDQVTRKDTTGDLRGEQEKSTQGTHGTAEKHSEGDSGIEQASRNAEEYPYVDHERECKDKGDVEEDNGREARCFTGGGVVRGSSRGSDVGNLVAVSKCHIDLSIERDHLT